MKEMEIGKTTKTKTPIQISLKERKQGTYVVGTTGTGKSTFLKNVIFQDMDNDHTHGLCVLDPHGDLIDDLLEVVPENRKDDVILFDPYETDRPFGLNLLDCDPNNPNEKRWVVSNMIGTIERLFTIYGPVMDYVLRHTLMTLFTFPRFTLIELSHLLLASPEEADYLAKTLKDTSLKKFWANFPRSHRQRSEMVFSTLNKLTPFTLDDMMRNIIGQQENTINIQEVMDEGKILFVNLSKGNLGESNSSLLGSVIVNQILMAALRRKSIPENDRKQFHLIVDEFQNFATESFAILQSEARKYGVDVTVAHQYRDQLDDLNLGSTLNVGNMILFRVTGHDSKDLASQFNNKPPEADTKVEPVYAPYYHQGKEFLVEAKLSTDEGALHQEVDLPKRTYGDVELEMANSLSCLPDYHAWCRIIRKPEDPLKPPWLEEVRGLTEHMTEELGDPEMAIYIRARSKKMGRPKEEVEAEIFDNEFKIIPDDYIESMTEESTSESI